MVPGREIEPDRGLTGIEWQEKAAKTFQYAQKQAISGEIGPIVTLWQQWGRNFPFTSKLTLRNAYFRGNEAPLSGS
ncbi:hypothetical protein [Mesorhizobium sp. M1D.F.Ca.ET.184.01.1.1]|nr:hypothetical protein [Mesorhizobium sp. M1D.F.Ca.ET.184.01.1.1]